MTLSAYLPVVVAVESPPCSRCPVEFGTPAAGPVIGRRLVTGSTTDPRTAVRRQAPSTWRACPPKPFAARGLRPSLHDATGATRDPSDIHGSGTSYFPPVRRTSPASPAGRLRVLPRELTSGRPGSWRRGTRVLHLGPSPRGGQLECGLCWVRRPDRQWCRGRLLALGPSRRRRRRSCRGSCPSGGCGTDRAFRRLPGPRRPGRPRRPILRPCSPAGLSPQSPVD